MSSLNFTQGTPTGTTKLVGFDDPVAYGERTFQVQDLPVSTAQQTALNGKQNVEQVKSANFTAVAGESYVITASATVTDPASPVNGDKFTVRVSAGTATVGGVAYSVAGSVITRGYNGTVWANTVFYDGVSAPVSTATQTALDLKAPLASPAFAGTLTLGSPADDTLSEAQFEKRLRGGDFISGNSNPVPAIVFVGDSLTYGVNGTHPYNYYLTVPAFNGVVSFIQYNLGVSGRTMTELNQQAYTVNNVCSWQVGMNIVCVMSGTNDALYSGATPEAIFGNLFQFCVRQRASGKRVIILTIPSALGIDPFKNAYNNLIRTWAPVISDGLADIGANPNLGADGAYNNATYFSATDKIHLTDAGYALMASIVQPVLDKLVAPQSINKVPTVGRVVLDGFDDGNSKFQIGIPQAKTSANDYPAAFIAASNDLTGRFGLLINAKGGATSADRQIDLQTQEQGSTNSGFLSLQGFGGQVVIGKTTSDGSTKLQVDGAVSATGGFVGNASTATALATARTINGVSFDGTANILDRYSGNFSGVGTATTAFTVTIGATMTNTSYKVMTEATNLLSAPVRYITNKTTTTFDVVYLSGLTGTVEFDWLVIP